MRNTTGEQSEVVETSLCLAVNVFTNNLTGASFSKNKNQYPAFETINIFLSKIFLYPHQYLSKLWTKKKKANYSTILILSQ